MYTQLSPESHGYIVNHRTEGYRITNRIGTPLTKLRQTREAALRDFADYIGRARERSAHG